MVARLDVCIEECCCDVEKMLKNDFEGVDDCWFI